MVSIVEPLKRFLIINPFGIGDVLFTTPVISNIKVSFPDGIIGYWCNERVKGVLENNPKIDKIFALSRGDIKRIYQKSKLRGIYKLLDLLVRIKKENFDVCLDFSLDHRYSLISKLLRIKKRIGFNYKKRGRFLTDKIDIDGYNFKHIVEYYLDLLKLINIEPKIHNLDLSVHKNNKIKIRNNDEDLIIGIAAGAGASWGKDAERKHWSAVKFALLADRILNDFKAKIILLGDESERTIADTIINAMSNNVIDLVGNTNLRELIDVISNLDILITNDGGPLHIAVALGVKTVSFFGPVDPKVYGPYPADSNRHIVLKKDLECSPCYRNFRLSECQNNKECLEKIEVGQALEAVSRLLLEKSSS